MRYWLMKSEPDVFSIESLKKAGVSGWDGVRNYQARNFIREMKKGDLAFFYHSNAKPPSIVGVIEIVREAYPDPTQFDSRSEYYDSGSSPEAPRWSQVDVQFVRRFSRDLSLDEIRSHPSLQNMVLVKRGRLSVLPVSVEEWETVVSIVG